MAIVFVTALIAVTSACLQGGKPCGGSFCPIDHACLDSDPDKDKVDYVCVAPDHLNECGNMFLEKENEEFCDDGNTISGDGCSADCTSDERCGNGIVDAEETCDCGADEITATDPLCRGSQNAELRGYCRHDCEVHCGDRNLSADEKCDPTVPVMTSCFYLRYDFGRPGCLSSCDELSATPCGSWNWSRQDPVTSEWLRGVWGTGPEDVFAVGAFGALLHYDGTSWLKLNSTTDRDLHAVWGAGRTSFVVGARGAIYRHTRTAP